VRNRRRNASSGAGERRLGVQPVRAGCGDGFDPVVVGFTSLVIRSAGFVVGCAGSVIGMRERASR
jgi:hypothetical protein